MRWESEPKKVNYGGATPFNYWAEMTAAEATDSSGDVQYYFECTNDSRYSSAWQSSPTHKVQIGGQHVYVTFQVRARDVHGNQTAPSPELPAI
jgi:hypothetical protein